MHAHVCISTHARRIMVAFPRMQGECVHMHTFPCMQCNAMLLHALACSAVSMNASKGNLCMSGTVLGTIC